MSKVRYRTWQVWKALTATPDRQALSEISEILSPALMGLFSQMQPTEQAHSLTVYQKIRSAGMTNQDLWVAALLHDVGKIRFPLNLLERMEIVLLNSMMPGKVQDWGQTEPIGWRKPFVVALQHPGWGADLAERAGATPMTVALIRRHQEKTGVNTRNPDSTENQLLKQLQIYDNES